ncbi:hypothetical protein [Polynucleobacter ibericus]|uniref:hypothetical protein n=1 Tax=Polynucleobacter ibericus TaxID=1819725 RepID=UPI001BFEABD6|nr:hypothetical protein [Polynucleobacter ibericus]QWE07919.1 hypothetical protein AOC20_05610 [Polynucleobacter ibericus]
MNDLEYVGKIKGMKTLKQIIESKEVVPASQLAKNKAAAEAQEKAFEEVIRSEESHRKSKISTGKVEGAIIGLESPLSSNSRNYLAQVLTLPSEIWIDGSWIIILRKSSRGNPY